MSLPQPKVQMSLFDVSMLLRMHLGWKYALGLEVDHLGFHYSSLCHFRRRLVDGGAERMGFDVILTALREAGLVRKGKRQRLDSTHILGNVARMSRRLSLCKREASATVKNPHDPDAQWSSRDLAKTKTWVGYNKVQVSETVSEADAPKKKGEPTEQFLTEVTTTEAIASDLDGMKRNLQAQAEHHDEQPAELYVDAAYVTDDTMAEAKEDGREIIGPARKSGNPTHLLDVDQFDVDVAHRTAICPAGHASRQCSLINDSYNASVYYRFEWAGLCDDCQIQKQCTRRKDGRRHVSVGRHHDLLQQRRRDMKTDEFKLQMHRRNAIEGSISEFTRGGGRRTRYRGLAKTTLANYFQGAAVNVNRWLRLRQREVEKRRKAAEPPLFRPLRPIRPAGMRP